MSKQRNAIIQRRRDAAQLARQVVTNESADRTGQKDHRHSPGRTNQLMLAEEMHHESFISGHQLNDWLMIWCPPGCCSRRCLVVASNGCTEAFDRHGWRVDRFQSLLPGGCRGWLSAEYTILDCLRNDDDVDDDDNYDRDDDEVNRGESQTSGGGQTTSGGGQTTRGGSRVYRVLDVMCWRGHPVYDCDTEFRQYWLQSKFAELFGGDYHQSLIAGRHERLFHPLQAQPCTLHTLNNLITATHSQQNNGGGGGVCLFYHRQAHYECGTTPLALWAPGSLLPAIRAHWWITGVQQQHQQ